MFDVIECSFELVECICTYLNVLKALWVQKDLIWGCWVKLYTFKGIKKIIWIKEDLIWGCWVQLCKFDHVKVIWDEENLIWCWWVQLYTFEGIKGIWVEEGLILIIWGCKSTLELNHAWFKWFEDVKAHLNWRGPNWSDLMVASQIRIERVWFECSKAQSS
jgi:hypothetical protein